MPAMQSPSTCDKLDYKLALHCAPVIAGMKPANILSIRKPFSYRMGHQLARIARPLGAKGIYIYRLAECEKRVLLLFYNRRMLQQRLECGENKALLDRYGYPQGVSVGRILTRLAGRIREQRGFPHEVGIFLGYPPRDVEGFIRNHGQNFQLCGYWKVYENVEEARRIFSVYDHVRSYYCSQVANGEEIYDITYGGTAI